MSAIRSAEVTTNARTTSTSVIMARSEALGPQQRVGQVKQQAERYETGERVIEDHGLAPLKPLTGIGVADTSDEEGQGKGPHENVQHGNVPVRREPRAERRRSRLPGLKCHRPHRFSRREGWRRYRNLIKIAVPAWCAIAHGSRDP